MKNPFFFSNILIIIVFCSGCVIVILGLSRILNYKKPGEENNIVCFQ